MKTQIILNLYDTLLNGGKVERKLFCTDNSISERTFYRYIKEINIFIMRRKRDIVLNVAEPDGVYYFEIAND